MSGQNQESQFFWSSFQQTALIRARCRRCQRKIVSEIKMMPKGIITGLKKIYGNKKKNHHNMQECTYLGDQRTFLSRWCAFCTESSKPWRCRTSWSDSSHYCNTIRATASSKSCRSERKHDIESKWTDGNKSGRVKFHYNHSRIITLSLSQNN